MSAKLSLNKFVKDIGKAMDTAISQNNMKEIGNRMIDIVVERTRRGYGVEKNNGSIELLEPLSERYVQQRSKNRRNLDGSTSPRKSNLTNTGQMLRSMTVKSANKGQIIVGPNERTRKGGITNARLGEIVQQKRPFNNLAKSEIVQVAKFVDQVLQLEIVKI